jgi:ActR/RegA family two-component response regulator
MKALNVLICEDEYLLAIDLASELGKRGVAVAEIIPTVAETLAALKRDDFAANAAVLDVQLLDGMAYSLVAPMIARGMAVVFCTGYGQRDLPDEFAQYPSVGKPTDVNRLLEAFERGRAKPVAEAVPARSEP